MSIRRVGNRWQVRVSVGGGRRVEQTLPPGASRDDARALETQIVRARIDAAVGRRQRYLIDDAITRWVESSARLLKSWPRDLRYRVDVIRQYTPGRVIEALPEIADRMKEAGQKSGLTAAAINRYVSILRRLGNLCERWGWTDQPLGRRVVMLPEVSRRDVLLTPKQIDRLARAADPLTADMIRFSALTGLRRGELLALRPDQVAGDVLMLDSATKSGRPRAVPLPQEAARIARKRLPWGVPAWRLRDRWEAARMAAGMPGVNWHDLRHAYGSWLAQSGAPLTAIRDLMGHSSLSVTSRYAHHAPEHLRQAVAGLPELGRARAGKTRARKKAAA